MHRHSGRPGPEPLVALDALRGVAAFAVVMGHLRAQTLLAQGHPEQGDGWQLWALVPTGFAAEAVAIFFVISGYLVGGQVVRNVKAGTFKWSEYVVRRMSRLYAVLIPALVFTMLLDSLTAALFSENIAAERAHVVPSLSDLACNLAYLQDSRCKSFGTNGSLWSLSYEFWFYVVFAAVCAAIACARKGRAVAAILNGSACVAVILIFGVHLLILIPAWIIGVALAMWQARRPEVANARSVRAPAILAATLLLVATSALSTIIEATEPIGFIVVGAAAVPLVDLATRPSPVWTTWIIRRLAWFGGWSYTLYAFHRPIVAFVAAGLGTTLTLSPSSELVVIYLGSAAIAAICFPAFFVGEVHTERIRAWLSALLHRERVASGVCAVEAEGHRPGEMNQAATKANHP